MMQDSKAVHTQTVRIPNERKGAYKKKIAHIVYSVIGGSALLLAGIPPIPANAELAPQCVGAFFDTTSPGPRKTLVVINGCAVNRKVKVILSNAPATNCVKFFPGSRLNYSPTYARGVQIIRIEKCELT
jgi:hypothetical protein